MSALTASPAVPQAQGVLQLARLILVFLTPHYIGRGVNVLLGLHSMRATMSKKGDRLREKAEELRTNADHIRVEECHRISIELAELADELADQWDALTVVMVGYLGERAAKQ